MQRAQFITITIQNQDHGQSASQKLARSWKAELCRAGMTHPGQCVLASFAVLAAASDQRAIARLVLERIRENDSLQDRLLLRVHPVDVCSCVCMTGKMEMEPMQNVGSERSARELGDSSVL